MPTIFSLNTNLNTINIAAKPKRYHFDTPSFVTNSKNGAKVSFAAKNIKFSDMGFLDEFDGKKTLEVYSLGTPVFRLSFDDYVCFDSGCILKQEFVDKYIA